MTEVDPKARVVDYFRRLATAIEQSNDADQQMLALLNPAALASVDTIVELAENHERAAAKLREMAAELSEMKEEGSVGKR